MCKDNAMNVNIKLALDEEKPRLRNLLAECLSELNKYGDVDVAYPYFDTYWDRGARRWPNLIRESYQPVGFAFVNGWSPSGRGTDFSMAEFYIVPVARGHGVGHDAAKTILLAHSGWWELSIMLLNASAQRFWPRAIGAAQAHELERIEGDGEMIYRFRIK